MLKMPTPICNALERPAVPPRMPWTILEIPLSKSAIAPSNIRIAKVNIGNCIRIIETPIISKPIPILTKRDRPDRGFIIPIAIRSIPITRSMIERIIMIEKTAGPMYSIITKESIMQIPPSTICNILSHGGFSSNFCNILLNGL